MIACDLEIDAGDGVEEIVARLVGALARKARLPRHRAYWLRLATEEIVTNIARHGYRGSGPVWLRGGVGPDRVWVRIEDAAPAFDPRGQPGPPPATELSRVEPGGYGLTLARHGTAEFRYERVGGRNRTTLAASRPADA